MPGTDPLISIITVCLNRAEFIADAVESVRRQGYPRVEHIVIDGGSTDGTLDLLDRYPDLRVVSEPDHGVYDAMNKGIRLAEGEIIGLLNSDDVYEDGVFADVAGRFGSQPELGAVAGGAVVVEEGPSGSESVVAKYDGVGNESLWPHVTYGVPIHNAWFFRADVFERVGAYDTRYALAADRDFLIRLELAGVRHADLGRFVYRYRRHPGSLTVSRGGSQRAKWLVEDLELSEAYLAGGNLPPEAERYFRLWHSRNAAWLVLLDLRALRVRGALAYTVRGWRHDGIWPVTVLKVAAYKLAGKRI